MLVVTCHDLKRVSFVMLLLLLLLLLLMMMMIMLRVTYMLKLNVWQGCRGVELVYALGHIHWVCSVYILHRVVHV